MQSWQVELKTNKRAATPSQHRPSHLPDIFKGHASLKLPWPFVDSYMPGPTWKQPASVATLFQRHQRKMPQADY